MILEIGKHLVSHGDDSYFNMCVSLFYHLLIFRNAHWISPLCNEAHIICNRVILAQWDKLTTLEYYQRDIINAHVIEHIHSHISLPAVGESKVINQRAFQLVATLFKAINKFEKYFQLN